jgi:phosphoribosyl 1,2-cyclic phosphodiesterase
MRIKFWGVRGSTPSPQPENMRYGGNTPCVEVTVGDERLILDAGTGIRNLGNSMMGAPNGHWNTHLFLSHLHWDHIEGIPFFRPMYDPSWNIHVHAERLDALSGVMAAPFFPLTMSDMGARQQLHRLQEGSTSLSHCSVQAVALHHPQGCFGFRITAAGATFTYATDTEPGDVDGDRRVRQLARGADVLVYDAHFLPQELAEGKRGWGHSHWQEAVNIAKEAGVRRLVLFHHAPDRSDAEVDAIMAQAQQQFPATCGAREGLEIHL